MKAKLHLVFSITILFSCFYIHGQQGYWKSIPKSTDLRTASLQNMGEAKKVFGLQRQLFSQKLEGLHANKGRELVYFPDAQGDIVPFHLEETPVLHPDLARKYPQIKSYTGRSPDGRYKIKVSSSPKGLESMVQDLENHKTAFMEPATNAGDTYVLYTGEDREEHLQFLCETQQSLAGTAKLIVPLVD